MLKRHKKITKLVLIIYILLLIIFWVYILIPKSRIPKDQLGNISALNMTGEITLANSSIVLDTTEPQRVKVDNRYKDFYFGFLKSIDSDIQFKEINPENYLAAGENINLHIQLIPKVFDETLLEQQIRDILAEDIDNYGVYVFDLKRDIEIGINQEKIMPPGSISKLPVAIMTLKEVDKGKLSLDQQLEFTGQSAVAPSNILGDWHVGLSFSLNEYLRFLIIDSDNSSIRFLEYLLGGYEELNERVKTELGVEHFFRDPHDVTAKDLGRVYRGIYFQEYLSKESNDYLLDLLKNTSYILQDGIPVGIPYWVTIAHKTGQISTEPGYAWADSGIIYGEKTDYILVILNEKIDIPIARYKVQTISKVVYDTLNAE
jgi:beta-lactamase class A